MTSWRSDKGDGLAKIEQQIAFVHTTTIQGKIENIMSQDLVWKIHCPANRGNDGYLTDGCKREPTLRNEVAQAQSSAARAAWNPQLPR